MIFPEEPNKTYVFNLGAFSPFQTILSGGAASLANGILYLAGPDGVLRTFSQPRTPEIAVEQPSGTDLADGVSAIDFGSVASGSSSAPLTFTIRNTGTADLTGIAVSRNGANASSFSVNTSGMLTTLTPGNSTSFAVSFSPGGTGARSAAIHIASNDADENPFDIALTGLAFVNSAPTDIALSASSIAENAGANATVGTLIATDPEAGQTHTFSLVSGTGDTDNGSFTIVGSTLKLTPNADFDTKSSYALRVRATDNGIQVLFYEEALTVTITEVVVDNVAPVITGTPPLQNVGTGSNLTAALPDVAALVTATDNVGVTSKTQSPIAGTQKPTGTYDVTVTVSDAAGNSAETTVQVTVVSGNKTPVAVADFAFSTASGVLIDVLENDMDGDGQPLTISEVTQSASGGVATIQGGKVFYDPEGAVTTPRAFTYTITDGEDSATATVTIYKNPALGFTYVGHLFDTDGTTHRGLMTLKLASGTGRFTGTIFIGAKKYGLKGTFSSESPTVAVAGASTTFAGIPVLVSAGPLDGAGFPQISFSVAGTVPGTRWRGLAERSPYFRLTTGQLLSPAAGKYTILFEQAPGSAQPIVAGGCSATVKVVGAARFIGKFGNGGALSTATYLLSGGRAIFYAPGAKSGVYQTLAGTLVFAPAADRDVSGDVLWSVPPGFDAKIPGGLVDSYPVVGSGYSANLNKLSPANLMLDYNATGEATFSFELPSSSRTVNVLRNITTSAIINGLPPLPQVKFTQSSGYYSGSFVDKPVTPGAKFQGWVLQHATQNRGNGYVLDTNRIGSVSLTPAP